MKLTVRISNDAAISLYKKEGYRTVDIWKKYYNDGEDGLVMEKNCLRELAQSHCDRQVIAILSGGI